MSKFKFKKDANYLIKEINLSESELLKLASLGIEKGVKVTFYEKSIFGFPLAFIINNRIIMLDKKTIINTIFEEIILSKKNEKETKNNKSK